jgi:hypothetical protein
MPRSRSKPSKPGRRLLLQLLVLLPIPLITGWIVWRGMAIVPPPTPLIAPKGAGGHGAAKAKGPVALPKVVAGWTRAKVERFNKKTLFDRINGAAPAYIAAGFQRLRAFDLEQPKPGKEAVSVEVYELSDVAKANALYLKERGPLSEQKTALAVGGGGHQSKGAVAFIVGGFYVKLAAFEAQGQGLLPKIAAELARSLAGATVGPAAAKPAKPAKASGSGSVPELPTAIAGWARAKVERFDKKTLFDRINGAAPAYITAGFLRLRAFDLEQPKPGKEAVSVEVYELSDLAKAKALYLKERGPLVTTGPLAQQKTALAVGDSGHQSKGAVAFIVGGFYVKLAAFEAAGQALLPKVAAELAAALKPTSS